MLIVLTLHLQPPIILLVVGKCDIFYLQNKQVNALSTFSKIVSKLSFSFKQKYVANAIAKDHNLHCLFLNTGNNNIEMDFKFLL